MNKEPAKLELRQVLRSDAADIMSARLKARIIHGTRDIDAAGDEVEQVVREVLRRKLATNYYIGHGHVADSDLNTSPQFDVIIADNRGAPVLFRAENGTEYFPYESVYTIGEVKATYNKSKRPVHEFVDNIRHLKQDLSREQETSIFLGPNVKVDVGTDERQPYRNPLCAFMLFASGEGFQWEDVSQLYAKTPREELPNIVCFLDRGVVFSAEVFLSEEEQGKRSTLGSINPVPAFVTHADFKGGYNGWVFASSIQEEEALAISFGYLWGTLSEHLSMCDLAPPDMGKYLNNVFTGVDITPLVSVDTRKP